MKLKLFILSLCIILTGCASNKSKVGPLGSARKEFDKLEYDTHNTYYVKHKVYRVRYDSDLKNPRWVSWTLTSNMVHGTATRQPRFLEDPNIHIPQGTHWDYCDSGYDRGHMCPAADNVFDNEAMKESFYVSNICPQAPRLNRGIWKKLETKCRSVSQDKKLIIVAGPIYDMDLGTIGNGIKVPSKFFKCIYDGELEYSYIFTNTKDNLYSINVSVDDVELATGLNLFPTIGLDESVTNNFWK